MGSDLAQALLEGDRAALDALLAPDAVFHSPVRTYRDRSDVLHLLALIGSVLGTDAEATRSWLGETGSAAWLTSTQPEGRLDGVLTETRDGQGLVHEVALLLRPVKVMLATIGRMGAALEAAPLPSAAPR